MTHTSARTWQYLGLIVIALALGAGYWYFSARAGSTITDRAITYNALTSGSATTTDPATTASITPGANRLILAAVTSNSLQSPTLTGNGLTWVEIGAIQDAARRTALFRAMGSAPTAGVVTIDWASAPGEQRWVISEFDNVDTSGTNGSGAVVQSATNYVDLTTTFTVTLGEFSSPGNATYGVVQAYTVDSNSVSSGSGFTGIVMHGTNFKQQAQYKLSSDTTVDWSNINNVYWRGIAVEIRKKGSTKLNTSIRDSLNEGLAGYWKLDDASGTTATDSSGNGYSGTLTNGPTWGTGQIGGATVFDGTNDVITAGNNLDIGTGDVTMSAWINAANANQCSTIMGKRVDSGGYAQYTFWAGHLNSSGVCVSSKKIACFMYDGTFVDNIHAQNYQTTDDILDGNWHHVVCRRTSGQSLAIFVDGVSRALTAANPNTTSVNTANAGPFVIGARNITGDTSFTGSIDEARLYKRALSDEEILRLYKTTSPSNPDTRLKGYWSFDGDAISGTTALDLSGAGNNGTLTNGPTKTIGIRGQAMSFDGSNDSMTVPDASSIEFNYNENFTLSTWVKIPATQTSTATTTNRFWGKWNGSGGYPYVFSVYNQTYGVAGDRGKIFFARYDGTNNPVITSTVQLNDDAWHLISVTKNSSALSLSIDGVVNSTATDTTTTTTTNATVLRFGDDGVGSYYFSGALDEVRIYNAALSASEIWGLYQEGNVKLNKSQSNNGDSLNDGLAGYWKLDDASGTTATDSSGNSNNGTLTNGPTWSTGQIGGAVTFDGANDSIALQDSPIFDFGGAGSFCHWLYSTVNQSGAGMLVHDVASGRSTTTYKWMTYLTTNSSVLQVYVRIGGTAYNAYGPTGAYNNTWHHVCGTFDKNLPADRLKIYIDGTLAGTATAAGSNVDSGDYPALGQWDTNYFIGRLDEARIYSRALSDSEVSRLYKTTSPTNPETGLVGYWSFNGADMSGTTAYDRSGKGNNGTLTNGPTLTIGRVGQAVNFDGANDSVVTPSIAMDPANGRSFSAWFKINSLAAEVNILNQNATVMNVRTDGSIRFYWTGGGYHYTSGITLTTGTWYHIVGVETTTSVSNYKIYINGTKYLDENDAAAHYGGSGALTIGSYAAAQYFPGVIDEVRAYTKSLSATEVANLYNFGR